MSINFLFTVPELRSGGQVPAAEFAPLGHNSAAPSDGPVPSSPFTVHRNEQSVVADYVFDVVVGPSVLTMENLLMWYEYAGTRSDNTIPCSGRRILRP